MDWWADVVGDDSYKWDNFLPWLKKSIAFTPPDKAKMKTNASIRYDASAFDDKGGPLHASYPNYRQPFDTYLEKAFSKSGLKEIDGLNSGNLDGYAASTFTIDPRAEVRSSSSESFLQEALDKTKLKVYTNSLVHKVLFDDKKKATGVLVETNKGLYTLSANKEVIVSAGTVSRLVDLVRSRLIVAVPLSTSSHAFRHRPRCSAASSGYSSHIGFTWRRQQCDCKAVTY